MPIFLSQLRYQVRPIGKHGHYQIFDTVANRFVNGATDYKAHEIEVAERHCAMWNRAGIHKVDLASTRVDLAVFGE